MSTSSRRTYPRQLPALPGHGATSAASPGPSATKRRALLSSSTPSACNCRARCPQTSPTSSTMCAAKTMLWSEILRTFTTARAAGRTQSAGLAARAVREAAVEHQRAKQLLENPELGRWSRHKARRALAEAGHRFDKALVAWESTGQPYATRLEAQRERLGAETGSARASSHFPGGVLRRSPRGPEPPR